MAMGNKTIMCKTYVRNGKCKYANCGYAHGFKELRIKKCNKGDDCKHISYDLESEKYYNLEMHNYVCKKIHPGETKNDFYRRLGYNNIPIKNKTEKHFDLKTLSLKLDFLTKQIQELHSKFDTVMQSIDGLLDDDYNDEEEKEEYPPTAPSSPVKKVSFKVIESKEEKEEEKEYDTDCSFIDKDEEEDSECSYNPSEEDDEVLYEEDNYIDEYVVLSDNE